MSSQNDQGVQNIPQEMASSAQSYESINEDPEGVQHVNRKDTDPVEDNTQAVIVKVTDASAGTSTSESDGVLLAADEEHQSTCSLIVGGERTLRRSPRFIDKVGKQSDTLNTDQTGSAEKEKPNSGTKSQASNQPQSETALSELSTTYDTTKATKQRGTSNTASTGRAGSGKPKSIPKPRGKTSKQQSQTADDRTDVIQDPATTRPESSLQHSSLGEARQQGFPHSASEEASPTKVLASRTLGHSPEGSEDDQHTLLEQIISSFVDDDAESYALLLSENSGSNTTAEQHLPTEVTQEKPAVEREKCNQRITVKTTDHEHESSSQTPPQHRQHEICQGIEPQDYNPNIGYPSAQQLSHDDQNWQPYDDEFWRHHQAGGSGEQFQNTALPTNQVNATYDVRTGSGTAYWGPHGEPGAQHTWYDARSGSGTAQFQPVSYPALLEPIERVYGHSHREPGAQYWGPQGEPGAQHVWYDARTGSGTAQFQPVSYPALLEPIERVYGHSHREPGVQYWGPQGEPDAQHVWYDARTGSGTAQFQPVSYPALPEPIAYWHSHGEPGAHNAYGAPHGKPDAQYVTLDQQYLARLTNQNNTGDYVLSKGYELYEQSNLTEELEIGNKSASARKRSRKGKGPMKKSKRRTAAVFTVTSPEKRDQPQYQSSLTQPSTAVPQPPLPQATSAKEVPIDDEQQSTSTAVNQSNRSKVSIPVPGNERPFQCKVCDKTYGQKANLTQHSKIHGVARYKCGRCDKTMVQKANIQRHMRDQHEADNGVKLRDYKCGLKNCDISNNQLKNIINHFVTSHPIAEKIKDEDLKKDFIKHVDSKKKKIKGFYIKVTHNRYTLQNLYADITTDDIPQSNSTQKKGQDC